MLWSCVSSRTWVCLLGWWSHRKSQCSRSHLRSHPIHPIANPTRVLVFKRRPIIIGIYLRRIYSRWSINLAENFWLSLSWICCCCCRRRRRKDDPLISSRVLYLNSECEFMVFCFQVVCNFLCSFQIRRSLQTTHAGSHHCRNHVFKSFLHSSTVVVVVVVVIVAASALVSGLVCQVRRAAPWDQQRKCEVGRPRHWQLCCLQDVVMPLQPPETNPNLRTEALQTAHPSSVAWSLPVGINHRGPKSV